MEAKLTHVFQKLKIARRKQNQFYDRDCSVTCVLHLELRLAEMMVSMIVKRGMAQAMRGEDDGPEASARELQVDFLSRVNHVIQTEILSTDNHKSEYKIHFASEEEGSSGTIAKIGFKKQQARRMIENIGPLLDVCFPDDETLVEQLKRSLNHYHQAMDLLRKRTDYVEEEIKQFRFHVDEWFRIWIRKFGRDTYSNYMHMMHSGHIEEEMRLFRCLYRYSQEGLEAMNALIKAYFYRRSERGGGKGEATDCRVAPIGRWVQRRWCWMAISYCERIGDSKDVELTDEVLLELMKRYTDADTDSADNDVGDADCTEELEEMIFTSDDNGLCEDGIDIGDFMVTDSNDNEESA